MSACLLKYMILLFVLRIKRKLWDWSSETFFIIQSANKTYFPWSGLFCGLL